MPFADVLRAQMRRPPSYSPGLVSRLSGVPKATIVNWLEGRVARPRRWQDLLRVADAMRLDRHETETLLAAASHLSLAELARRADGDHGLLAARSDRPRASASSSAGCVAAGRSGELDDRSLYKTASPPTARTPAAAMTPTRGPDGHGAQSHGRGKGAV